MKKINTILVAACMAASFCAVSAEWNFQSSGFNQDGNVTITQESGEIRQINNKPSSFSTASAPTFVNVQASNVGAPMAFKPVQRSFYVRGMKEARMTDGHYNYNYVGTKKLPKKCLLRSMSVSVRSQRGATIYFLGGGVAFNGAVSRVDGSAETYKWGTLGGGSSKDIYKNHVETQYQIDEWGLFKVINTQSGYYLVLFFETPLLIEEIKLGLPRNSADPWYGYTVNYKCMAEY